MAFTDEEYREAYKPLQIPAHYYAADTQENKIYPLPQLREGAVTCVIGELEKLEQAVLNERLIALTKTVLTGLFDKGLLNGHEKSGVKYYNLQKRTHTNDGAINTELLAPGLD